MRYNIFKVNNKFFSCIKYIKKHMIEFEKRKVVLNIKRINNFTFI